MLLLLTAPWLTVFQLHGSVNHARCCVCNATINNYDPNNFCKWQEECNVCTQSAEARTKGNPTLRERVARGTLRPRVTLYEEPNPDEEATIRCFKHDIKARPDAIVVIGTKLSIPDLRRSTLLFCDNIRARKGVAVWISNEPPAQKVARKFDYILKSACDDVMLPWLQLLSV